MPTRSSLPRWERAFLGGNAIPWRSRPPTRRDWPRSRPLAIRPCSRPTPSTLPCLAEMEGRYLAQSAALRETREQALAAGKAQHEREWTEMAQRWNAGVARFVEAVESIRQNCARLFPDWSAADAPSWTPPAETPAAVRFGQINVQMAKIRGGIPDDPRLKPPATEFILPLLLPLPDHSLLVLKAGETGRAKAIESLQASMLRLADLDAAGQGPLHDLRPGGPGREFLRLHAPGRLRRTTRLQPHLDRLRSHRAAAGRPHAAHGERDPGLSPQRVRFDPGIQRLRRRDGRALPHPGDRQLPGELHRDGRAALEEHRGQRGPLRRVRPACRRFHARAAGGTRYAGSRADLGPRYGRHAAAFGEGAVRLEASRIRRGAGDAGRPAAARAVHRDRARRGPRGPRRRPRRGALPLRHSRRGCLVDQRQPQRHRRPPGPRRRDETPEPRPGPRHLAARAHLRQDGLRQVDAAARADHQRGPPLQSRRGRTVPRRLQERRGVQGLLAAPVAARPGDRHRERTGVRPERLAAAGRRTALPRRSVPPPGRAGPQGLPQRPARRDRSCWPASC